MLRVVLFGGLMVSWGERPLPTIASTVARSLFAYLLTYHDRPHTRDLVAGTFWPELPDDVARRRLSQALWQIRKALEPQEIVLSEGDTLQINADLPLWLDVEQFMQHQKQGTADQHGAVEHGERCVALYKGEFLAGYYDDWLFPERERLRELFLDALDCLVVGYKRQGEYGAALAHARRLAAEDPLREHAHREVMRLCHLLGRDAEALQQFETCRQILAEELGVEPSHKIVALAQEITERGAQAAPLDLPQPVRPSAAFLVDDAQGPELPLVGREAERAELLSHVQALFQSLGGLVLVEGEAGVGKTRLLQAIAGDAEWRGAEVLWGRGQQAEAGAPYGPLVKALSAGLSPLRARQLGQIVDEIWLQVAAALLPPLVAASPQRPPPPALEPAQERDRLVNALAQLLAGWAEIVPLLLVVEDLHWAGHDTLDLLARLVPLLGDGGVLILGSYRGEEARARPETWQRLQALDQAGVRQRLVLNRLDAAATGRLVRRSLGLGNPAPLFETRLFAETQGNPLFVLETLRALHGEGLLSRDEHGRWSTPWDDVTADYGELPLPRAVEQIIARRLEALAPPLRETIHLAAVLGERFDFDLLSAAGAAEAHDLVGRLWQLIQRRFLDETAADYCFHHDKIRQVAYDDVEAADRPRLHHRVAQALESLQPQRVAALAHHWMAAEVWPKAAAYHQRAGDRAREVYANAEAAAHYSRALEALERLPGPPDPVRAYELRLAREAVHHLLGQRAAQAEDLAALEVLLQDPRLDGSDQRLGVLLRRTIFGRVTGDYEAALAAAREAAQQAQAAGNVQAEYQAHLNWGQMLLWQGELVAAREHIEQAYGLAQASQDLSAQAATLNTLGALAAETADYEARMSYYRRALAAGQQSGDQTIQASIHNGLANLLHELADYEAAADHHQQALALRRAIGDRRGEAITFYNLGRVYYDSGDRDAARRMFEQVCGLSRVVGERRLAGYGHTFLGLVLEEMGELDAAQATYSTALNLRREVGLHALAVDALAGLARVASARGDHDRAAAYAGEVLAWLDERGIEGVGDPLLAYKAAYRALFAAGEEARGRAVLQVAYDLLMDRAGGIADPERRRAYLHDIEPNRGIWNDYQTAFARAVVTRLPHAEAPTGRPLRDDEYVTVTWTLVAPEDEALPPGPARRQAQLRRLLRQASEQGAAPGVGDLAAALAVSEPTVRRDLAALRRAGHPVRTRGSRGE